MYKLCGAWKTFSSLSVQTCDFLLIYNQQFKQKPDYEQTVK